MTSCDRHTAKREAVFRVGGDLIGYTGKSLDQLPTVESRGPDEARDLCEDCLDEFRAWLRERV